MQTKIGFLLPRSILTRCFAPEDLQRLATRHTLILPEDDQSLRPGVWLPGTDDAEIIVTGWGTPALTDTMLAQNPNMRVLAHAAGSTRYLLSSAFWSRGVRLASANESLGVGVAESTLALIVAGLKGFFPAAQTTRSGEWRDDAQPGGFPIRELYRTTVGLIGASKIGRHVIRLLRNFDVDILLADPYISDDAATQLGVTRVSLDELLSRSEVVSLHAPALPETRHMLGRAQFKRMRDHAIFINTARGMIVDEAALCDELATGRLFAFIDVTDPEPPRLDHPFRKLPNVVLLPHIAGAIGNGCLRMGRSITDQIFEYEAGQTMHGEITEAQWQVMA